MFSKGSKYEPTAAAAPAKAPPSATGETGTGGVPSIISPDLTIVGDLRSEGDLQVDGAVEGDITSRLLTIGQSARVQGALTADTVRVYGRVQGRIEAKSVALASTARVDGDIVHESLSMEAGASVEGRLIRRVAPAAARSSAAMPEPVSSVAASSAAGSGSKAS